MQIFLPRNLFAEAYYPAHGSFVAKRYSIIHGTWTPKQKMEILEKWIVLCSTVSAANGEWKCPLQALTDWRHDFILRETIVHTESPMQVVDINSGSIGSSPKYFTYADNSVYYSAYRPWVGTELFKSSVFTTGATLVQDIATGSLGSFPSNFASVNNTIYFSANDGILGQELRKANSSGSQIVFDLIPWSGGSNPSFLKNINNTLHYMAEDPSFSWINIWAIDGLWLPSLTLDNTFHPLVFLADNPYWEVYFVDTDATTGHELSWLNTLTRETYKFDIHTGSSASFPFYGIFEHNNLYFHADDGIHGSEVWKANANSGTSSIVKDIMIGTWASSEPRNFTAVNGIVYFTANDGIHWVELWKIDENENITMVNDIFPGNEWSVPKSLVNADGTLYFSANNGINGEELWKINESGNVEMVSDLAPWIDSSSPTDLTNIHGTLYFSATNSWAILGKLHRTVIDAWVEVVANNISLQKRAAYITYTDNGIFFAGDNGSTGMEPWKIPLNVYTQEIPYTLIVGDIPSGLKISSPVWSGTIISRQFEQNGIPILIESTQAIWAVSLSWITIKNGIVDNLQRVWNKFTLTVYPSGHIQNDVISLQIATGALKDAYYDSVLEASNILTWKIDTEEPNSLLLTSNIPNDSYLTWASLSWVQVKFYTSEYIDGFSFSDIVLTWWVARDILWNTGWYYSFTVVPNTRTPTLSIQVAAWSVQDIIGNYNILWSNILTYNISNDIINSAYITSIQDNGNIYTNGTGFTFSWITNPSNTVRLIAKEINGTGGESSFFCSNEIDYFDASIFTCNITETALKNSSYSINTESCNSYGSCIRGNSITVHINKNSGNLYTFTRMQQHISSNSEHTFTIATEYGENRWIAISNAEIQISIDPNTEFIDAYFLNTAWVSRKLSWESRFINHVFADSMSASGNYDMWSHSYTVQLWTIQPYERWTIQIHTKLWSGITSKELAILYRSNISVIGSQWNIDPNPNDNTSETRYLLNNQDLLEIYFWKIETFIQNDIKRCDNSEIIIPDDEIITKDITNYWAGSFVKNLINHWVIANNSYFLPQKNITRAEYVTMVVRWLSCKYAADILDNISSFNDIEETSEYNPYIGFAESKGWIQNRTGYFRPNDSISRSEAVQILMNAMENTNTSTGSFDDIGQAGIFQQAVKSAKYFWFINGQYINWLSFFFPNRNLLRWEAAKMISKAYFPSFTGSTEVLSISGNTTENSGSVATGSITPWNSYTGSITISTPTNNTTIPLNYAYIDGYATKNSLVRIFVNWAFRVTWTAWEDGTFHMFLNSLEATNTIYATIIDPNGAELTRSNSILLKVIQ